MEDEVFNMMLSVIVLCRVFDRDHRAMKCYEGGTHPAPVLRALRFGEVLHATFEAFGTVGPESLYDVIDMAWWEASQLAASDGMPAGRWRGKHMNDVPQDMIEKIRRDHVEFDQEMELLLARLP